MPTIEELSEQLTAAKGAVADTVTNCAYELRPFAEMARPDSEAIATARTAVKEILDALARWQQASQAFVDGVPRAR